MLQGAGDKAHGAPPRFGGMRSVFLAGLLVPLLLAGCASPPGEPLLQDPGGEQAEAPPGEGPAPSPPPAPPPPEAPATSNATSPNGTAAEPGAEDWDGRILLSSPLLSNNDGVHEVSFPGPVGFNMTVSITTGVGQGGLRTFLEPRPEGGCGEPNPGNPEATLEAEGASPLVLAGEVPAGDYCVWVFGASDAVHVVAEYRAEASWVPA